MNERVALLDAALRRRFAATPALPQAQIHALEMLRDRPELDISEVARAVGWSRKHLASRVHDAVGVGPRSWRRLIRFEGLTRKLAASPAPDWAFLAQDAGYFYIGRRIKGAETMPKQSLIPCLRYIDAPAAIDFLCKAFGFERHAVYGDDEDPTLIHHAQLRLGDCMVMLSSARRTESSDLYRWKTPDEAGGITACICCVIEDPDAHYVRAAAAGADIVTRPHANEGYPGRSYNARDPEGNDWDFGTYDPWA